MRLWLLQHANDDRKPIYDANYGFVIRAENEEHARAIAMGEAADEGVETWRNPTMSTCTPLERDGEAGVVLIDFNAG